MSESNLEDRAAIHDFFTRYCCALDNGEIEPVVDCFTVDAILKSPPIDISGRDEIRAFAGRFAAHRTAGTQFRHMVSNIAVTISETGPPLVPICWCSSQRTAATVAFRPAATSAS